jgi:CheY-like chemotaxis protein
MPRGRWYSSCCRRFGMRVLIVEDDRSVGSVLQDFLLELGHESELVLSAEGALDRLQQNRPDLILLDFRLPGMNGLDFLQRPQVKDSRIPVILVSGIASEVQIDACLRLGAVEFVAKPIAFEHLHRILQSLEPQVLAREIETARRTAERRRTPRARVALPVRVRDVHGGEWETTSVDLSAGGIKVRSAGPSRPAATVELSFATPGVGDRFDVSSLLVRVDVDGYVFHFANLTRDQLERLTLLVRRLAASSRPE